MYVLKEQLYSLRLAEGKSIFEHLQLVNLIVTQLVGLGIDTPDKDLVDITLSSLPKSWSVFRQIQKSREHTPIFPKLEGLMFQEELGCNIEKDKDEQRMSSPSAHPTLEEVDQNDLIFLDLLQ